MAAWSFALAIARLPMLLNTAHLLHERGIARAIHDLLLDCYNPWQMR